MITIVLGAALAASLMLLLTGTKVLQEYERGIVFRFGRAKKALANPGFNLLLPLGIDRIRVVDVRTRAIQITPQDIITRDNITVSVDAVVYASVSSPMHAVLEVEDYMPATLQLASTTLRAVLGKMEMDDILAHRDAINNEVRQILDTRTEQWGVEISAVEIKDIQLPTEMQRAMARQAEAERERRAKVIAAEGEVQAASKLAQAAAMIAEHPGALQLRLYQTLVEVAGEASSTIVFPVPIDLGGASAAGSAAQVQSMMQTALALAAKQDAQKQIEGKKRAEGSSVSDDARIRWACGAASGAGAAAPRSGRRHANKAPAPGRRGIVHEQPIRPGGPSRRSPRHWAAGCRRRLRTHGRMVASCGATASVRGGSVAGRRVWARRGGVGDRRRCAGVDHHRRIGRRRGGAHRRGPLLLGRAHLAVVLTRDGQAAGDGVDLGEAQARHPGRAVVVG